MSAPLAFMVLALTAWPSGSAGPEDRVEDKAPVDFAREVRPILSDKCFQCHGPDPETREAGLRVDSLEGITAELSTGGHAVVAGDVEDSELLYRIAPGIRGRPDAARTLGQVPLGVRTLGAAALDRGGRALG